MNFTCGHTQEDLPRNMGRGAARQKRLAEFFNRKCLHCRLQSEDEFEKSLTIPRSTEQQQKVREQIISSYR